MVAHYSAERSWYQASESAKYGSFEKAKEKYKDAHRILKFNGDFLFNYGAEARVAGDYNLSIMVLENAKKYNSNSNLFLYLGDDYFFTNKFTLAEKNYKHAIYIAPSHIYPKYQLIQLYKTWKKTDLADIWTIKTLQCPLKIKNPITENLLIELREGVKDKSIR